MSVALARRWLARVILVTSNGSNARVTSSDALVISSF